MSKRILPIGRCLRPRRLMEMGILPQPSTLRYRHARRILLPQRPHPTGHRERETQQGRLVVRSLSALSSLLSLNRPFYSGNALVILGTSVAIVGLTWAGTRYAWSSAAVLVPLIVGLAIIALFLLYEAKVPSNPTIPWEIISNRTSFAAYLATGFHGIISISLVCEFPFRSLSLITPDTDYSQRLPSCILPSLSRILSYPSWCPNSPNGSHHLPIRLPRRSLRATSQAIHPFQRRRVDFIHRRIRSPFPPPCRFRRRSVDRLPIPRWYRCWHLIHRSGFPDLGS